MGLYSLQPLDEIYFIAVSKKSAVYETGLTFFLEQYMFLA